VEGNGRTLTWNYDGIYRLTNESVSNDPANNNGSVGYDLDPVGNRTSVNSTLPGVASVSITGFNADDWMSPETYDSNGNTLTTGGKSFSYDSENHLMSMNGGTVKLIYDGDGNRVAKIANGVITQYLVDDLNPTGYAQVVEEIVNGAVTKQYTYGLQRIDEEQVINNVWTTSFYGYDGAGSVRQLTNLAGTVTDSYEYDAFGNSFTKTGSTPNNYLYRGEQYDSDLGLYYLRARYYNPQTGRFMSRDPEEGNVKDPATLHKYLYAGGDPVNAFDPTGRVTITKPTGGIGGAIGEWSALVQDISLRVFVFSTITVPTYMATPQGAALKLLVISGVSIALAESCELIKLADWLSQLTIRGPYVTGPEMDCNTQEHPRTGGAGEGGPDQ